MRVIPVMDLKNSLVVHAVAGQRERYRPVRSVLASDARPATVARAFRDAGVFDTVYVADLDAISGGQPDRDALRQIAATGLKIWLDAGVDRIDRLREISQLIEARIQVEAVILGLESLPDEVTLGRCVEELGSSSCIFSLDLRAGKPITRIAPWQQVSATRIAGNVAKSGIERMIVLDLANVGTGRGPRSAELCRRIHAEHPQLELICGGGVRHAADLEMLSHAGCAGVLVATGLHNGTIRPCDLAATT